jgi:predicted deacylase
MSKDENGKSGKHLPDLIINNEVVAPGEQTVIKLTIGKLPSGTRIFIHLHVYRSSAPGPTMLVLGGLHGDEINGVEIVRRGISSGLFSAVKAGSIIAIPLLNVHGFINFSREVPDGKDVNRSFPGTLSGSLASRVARTLTKKVLPSVDFVIDYHTGGGSRYNYPQIRFSKDDVQSEMLARYFGAPYIIQKGLISGTLRKVCKNMGIPVVVYEGGEALRFDGLSIDFGLDGLKRVMMAYDMYEDKDVPHGDFLFIQRTTWVRASQSGMFLWYKQSGQQVTKGEPLGQIGDPFGSKITVVRAPRDGHIIGHNNGCVVHQGDALFNLGLV